MTELRPFPFRLLVGRLLREGDRRGSLFDLPSRRFFLGREDLDFAVRFHGKEAATPLGPAAGPQSQMAQNLVLSWLGGSRILELKTVQINDALQIPRPCIDMQTVGYNVEWSQELKLEESLEEYVKGAMLIEILCASGLVELPPEAARTIYDMSVGYDLAGIRSERVDAFIRGMLDCTSVVDRLRSEIPSEFAQFRDLDFPTRLADTLTLSTFHGCPPDEIERIIEFLLEHHGIHCIVKLNPMLLGARRTRELLGDELGYEDIRVPESAFERDTKWSQAEGFVERLGDRARSLGLGFGVKFTNTLIVENHRSFFPSEEREMYLSGPPLHVLAMNLVGQFRGRFGDRYPVSFSAGIDRKNFPDAAALGLVPITVCSDLLKPGGYGRSKGYFDELGTRMEAVGARDIDSWILRAYGQGGPALDALGLGHEARENLGHALDTGGDLRNVAGDAVFERWLSEARIRNTALYVEQLGRDPRYASAQNAKVPRKIGSALELFDCITCDKCIPVCPNDANFTFALPKLEVPILKVNKTKDGTWASREDGKLTIEEKHQIANFADFCNDCGNCDVFCPEDGGPYVVKPRFFGNRQDWEGFKDLDGFFLYRDGDQKIVLGRCSGAELRLDTKNAEVTYRGPGFELRFREGQSLPENLRGEAEGEVDLAWYHVLAWVRDAFFEAKDENYVTALL